MASDRPSTGAAGFDTSPVPARLRWTPGLALPGNYRRGWLPADLLAALALTGLLVPQGMAYAQLAGLPAVTGLYTTVMALVAYAVFGPSRILVVGPDSALGPMIASALLPLVAANQDPAQAVALSSTLALVMGVICTVAGVARAGMVTELLSRPVRVGYLNGLAIVVLVSQLPKLFGFSTSAPGLRSGVRAFWNGVASGLTEPVSLLIGLACLATILALRVWRPKVPAVLLAVVSATVLASVLDLSAHGVAVLGVIPS